MSGPSPELRAKILAAAQHEPAPTRSARRRRDALAATVGIAAMAALFFAFGGVKPGGRPAAMIVFAVGLAALAALALRTVLGARMLGPSRRTLAAMTVLAPVACVAIAVVVATAWAMPDHALPMRSHVACTFMTIVHGALALGVMIATRRGSDPVHPALTGAALGVIAGAWAASLAWLRCPHVELGHGLVAHVAPIALAAALGAVVGRRALAIQRSRSV